MLSVMLNLNTLAVENPALIVKIVRIMENEEHFEQSLRMQQDGQQIVIRDKDEKISPFDGKHSEQ